MSSDALREAKVWLEQLASADRELVRTSGLAAALLAEVARLEQERDEHDKTASLIYDDLVAMESRALAAEAALAVAREREQRLTEALEAISWMNDHDAVYHAANRARAALVDEPAAATLAEPEPRRSAAEPGVAVPASQEIRAHGDHDPQRPGSASAAADEPTTCPRCGNETTEADLTYSGCGVCRAEAAAADLVDAAADEPGETP